MSPEAKTTSPVELLWDLVFVFAVTRVTALLADDLTGRGFFHAMLVLALIWWAWSAFVWAANAEDADSATLRAVLLVALVLVFVAGLALPTAFGAQGLLFACTYTAVRALHVVLYARASRRGNADWSVIYSFVAVAGVGLGLLIVGATTTGATRAVLWTVAALIDYAGPGLLIRKRLRGLQAVAVGHFAERYGLFVLICLGESLVAVGIGAGDRRVTTGLVLAVMAGVLVTVELWWVYFATSAEAAQRRLAEHPDPVLAASDAYSYLHLPLVAGIIVFAVGIKATIHDVTATLGSGPRLALCGGVALFLLAHWAFRERIARQGAPAELLAAVALLALWAAGGGLRAWELAAALVLIGAALCLRLALRRGGDGRRGGPGP